MPNRGCPGDAAALRLFQRCVMRDMFARLDDGLIDRFCQPLVDWLADHVEIDCFRIARLCTDLAAGAWVLSQAELASTAARSGNTSLATFQAVLILCGLGGMMTLRTLFQRPSGGRSGNRAQANPLRAGMFTHRVASLLWLAALGAKTFTMPPGLSLFALLAVGLFGTASLYLGSCTTPPPRTRTSSVRRMAHAYQGM